MKHVSQKLEATWLGDHSLVQEYDRFCRELAIEHRNASGLPVADATMVAPWTVDLLVGSVGRFARDGQAIWCTSALAQLGELIFCAEDGTLHRSPRIEAHAELNECVDGLQTIRNVCFHPAFHRKDPHMLALIRILENRDSAEWRRYGEMLRHGAWSQFAAPAICALALNLLNSGGRLYATLLRSQGQAFLLEPHGAALARFRPGRT